MSDSTALVDEHGGEEQARLRDRFTMLLRAAVAVGVVARIVQYLWRRSYWHDEAFLVLNVTSLSQRQLVGPLPHAQSAPPGFLVAQKGLFDALGQSEYVLRLIPLALGCAAVVLMAVLARRWLGTIGMLFAVALFALSDRLIAHAVEAKQYSGDVFFALVLLLAATNEKTSHVRRLLTASLVAAAALWVSHPVVFLFGGIGLALLPSFLGRFGARGVVMFALCCLPALASFAALYLLSIRYQEVGDLYSYWADRFPPWSRPWMLPIWLVHHLIGLCRYPYEIGGEVVFALACCGAWAWWRQRRRRQLLGILLAPVGLTLLASFVGRYPFGGSRVTLFLAPAMFLLAGQGVEWLWARVAETKWRGVGIALPAIVLGIGIARAGYYLAVPRHRGHIRPAVQFVRQHWQAGEAIYVIGEDVSFLCYWRKPELLRPLEPQDAPAIPDERFWVVAAIGNRRDRREVESAMMRTADRITPPRRWIAYRGGAAYQFVRATWPATTGVSEEMQPWRRQDAEKPMP